VPQPPALKDSEATRQAAQHNSLVSFELTGGSSMKAQELFEQDPALVLRSPESANRHPQVPSSESVPQSLHRTALYPSKPTVAGMRQHSPRSLHQQQPESLSISDPVDLRKQQSVADALAQFQRDLSKMRTTQTFSQFHYSNLIVKKAVVFKDDEDDESDAVETQSLTQRGPRRQRTVAVIQKDLEKKFQAAAPWYNKPGGHVFIADKSNSAKFSLTNWSPLLHRYMLANGENNPMQPKSLTWTL
jgi:hypothetical protein